MISKATHAIRIFDHQAAMNDDVDCGRHRLHFFIFHYATTVNMNLSVSRENAMSAS